MQLAVVATAAEHLLYRGLVSNELHYKCVPLPEFANQSIKDRLYNFGRGAFSSGAGRTDHNDIESVL